MMLLLVALGLILGQSLVAVLALSNGQNASLVIGQSTFTTNTVASTQSGLNYPFGINIDSVGNLWVVDTFNYRVLRFAPPFSNGMNADLVLGQSDFTSKKAAVTQSGLYGPWGTVFDSTGNLWVADLYGYRVLRYSQPFTSGMNANLVLGQTTFTTSTRGTAQNKLDKPAGMAFDSTGNLWVAEDNNNRVVRFTPPFTNGMNASLVIGQSSFTSNVAATTQNGLHSPFSIAFDAVGNLWVADGFNSRVLRFSPPFSSGMSADLVIGQSSFTSKAAATTQNGLNGANGLAFDPRGNLWIVDNNRALRFSPPFTNGMNANLVIGQASFSSRTVSTTQSGLSDYVGAIAFDSTGNPWILDSYNNRALQYQCGAECPSSTVSFTYSVQGGGTGYAAPVLTYMSGGRQQTAVLPSTSASYSIDYGSTWSVTGTLTGSSSSERWKTAQATTGIATASQSVSLVYYHQYLFNASYSLSGGGSPTAPTLTSIQHGASYTTPLTTASTVYWLDSGALWSVTNPLAGSTSSERWYTSGTASGTVSGMVALNPTYNHQFLLTVQSTPSGSGMVSQATDWFNSGASVSLTATANEGWQFAGWTGSGPGSYTGTNNPVTLNVGAAITEVATFKQLNLQGSRILGPYPTTPKVGDAIGFESLISGQKAPYDYLWDFGDGKKSVYQNPVWYPQSAGTYTVKLEVTDASGLKTTVALTITVSS